MQETHARDACKKKSERVPTLDVAEHSSKGLDSSSRALKSSRQPPTAVGASVARRERSTRVLARRVRWRTRQLAPENSPAPLTRSCAREGGRVACDRRRRRGCGRGARATSTRSRRPGVALAANPRTKSERNALTTEGEPNMSGEARGKSSFKSTRPAMRCCQRLQICEAHPSGRVGVEGWQGRG